MGLQSSIFQKAHRGNSNLDADPDIKAGEYLMLDIQTNPGRIQCTKSTTYSHFLQITDAISRLTVLLVLASVSSADIFDRDIREGTISIVFKQRIR